MWPFGLYCLSLLVAFLPEFRIPSPSRVAHRSEPAIGRRGTPRNIALIVIEVDAKAAGDAVVGWVSTLNVMLLVFYIAEIVVRFFALRIEMLKD